MMPTAEVVDLSKSEKTLKDMVMEDINKLPDYTPYEKERRVNQEWYAAVIMMTQDGSELEKIHISAAASLLRAGDRICYNPERNKRVAGLLLPGGKFIPDVNEETISQFEKEIKSAVEHVVTDVKRYSPRFKFVYFNYHNEHDITPRGFAEVIDKMLDYL